jgi:hypothetical protein
MKQLRDEQEPRQYRIFWLFFFLFRVDSRLNTSTVASYDKGGIPQF